jgi:phosphatidylserine/phosphatidylglycerophosphate/cardiolipin synthase-like enzyme
VVSALRDACARGVAVHLVLKEAAASEHALSRDARLAFTALGDAVSFWVWPRTPACWWVAGPRSCTPTRWSADDSVALVSSANLTESALSGNMELGIVVRGGGVPRRLARHLRELMDGTILERMTVERSSGPPRAIPMSRTHGPSRPS